MLARRATDATEAPLRYGDLSLDFGAALAVDTGHTERFRRDELASSGLRRLMADMLTSAGVELAQLVATLLDHAVSYSSGGEVALALRAERRAAVLEVVNRAGGIDEGAMEHAFERFFRADAARSGAEGHFGLGLPIAKTIVEGHGGTIALNCRQALVRACVRLPLATPPPGDPKTRTS